ncbi:17530_t:CDS:2 [Gigaspora margarita]|uniref:17530_t:CDS:1 n=1 Tax=Gigaspora margarita TaxID=4874 RepID=A0ABN7VAU9_GIGMA|nr:17530_t:CDS:2 [Gigaspora margarita]
MANSKTEAKDLPCLFRFLVKDYPEIVNKANILVKYLPKLSPLLFSLKDYSVCQKHYNNIIVKNFFLEQLEQIVSISDPEYKSLVRKIDELEYLNKQLLLENDIPNNQVQNFKNPWLNQNLDMSQIEELFGLTSKMQTLLDRQLHDYLLTIITELCKEKSENINVIDDLVINQSAKTSNQKQCREYGKNEIENSKRKCPQCHAKLPTLAETQQESEQTIPDKKDSAKSLIFKPYQPGTSEKAINLISITQKLEPQDNVDTTDILVPDPLPINPNSIDNVRKVFDHIQKISGINNGSRKWIVVVCDGIPYHYAQKFKNEYPGIILLPGPLHEKMNMLKAFVELNWYKIQFQTMLRKKLFATMEYADSESLASFLNPNKNDRSFESLDRTNKLSAQMKSFSHKAQIQRINYIKHKFGLINSSEITHPIPVTFDEVQLQLAKSSLKKEEILFTIETLIESLNEAKCPQFRGLRSKRKDELLTILQQLRDLHNITDTDEIEEEETI